MSRHMVRDLENLQRQLLNMAAVVEESIFKATRALQEHDHRLAQEVILGDNVIDEMDNLVTEECLKLLALHQPVARDLRRIATTMMITTDLERMGDLATDIANRALAIEKPALDRFPEQFVRMADQTTAMVRQSLDAFVNLDSRSARRVIRLDDEVDAMHAELLAQLVAKMKQSPVTIDGCMSLFSAVRHMERIADHATNIAEDVVYLVEGEIVKHRPEALDRE